MQDKIVKGIVLALIRLEKDINKIIVITKKKGANKVIVRDIIVIMVISRVLTIIIVKVHTIVIKASIVLAIHSREKVATSHANITKVMIMTAKVFININLAAMTVRIMVMVVKEMVITAKEMVTIVNNVVASIVHASNVRRMVMTHMQNIATKNVLNIRRQT